MRILKFAETVAVGLLAGCAGAYLTHLALRHDAAIGPAIAEYIQKHPTAISAAVNANRTEQRQAQVLATIKAHHAEIFADKNSPTMGDPHGDVTVVEFFDFRCPYCKSTAVLLEQLVNRDRHVRIVFKNLPVLGPDSVYAARLGMGAAQLGRFPDFFAANFNAIPAHADRATIDKAVRSMGLESHDLLAQTRNRSDDDLFRRDSQLAASLGINGTPAIIVGDRLLEGAPTEEQLIAAVHAARGNSSSEKL